MLAYWVAFLAVVPGALMRSPLRKPGWLVIGTALSLFVGLRYQVGGDWDTYLTSYFYVASRLSLGQALLQSDPGYVLINWIATHAGLGVWAVNLFCAAAFCSGLVALCRRLPEPLLALVAAIPYLVIVFAMGYTRQAAAFGFVLWALTFLLDRRLLGFVLLMAVAASFHKTAVILM
ncbi:MAG: EpsG family protein, partial [Salinisphaera sp.]|nr:EpsG family protein [Salinisphaera sp.]